MFKLIYDFQGRRYEVEEENFEQILAHTLSLWHHNCFPIQIEENGELFKTTKEIYKLINKCYY